MRSNFKIGTFNLRGLNDTHKQDSLARDVDNYKLDICALQETKIENGLDISIGKNNHRLICFKTDSRHYGNGFVVSSKWTQNIHRSWRVSDRVSVIQLLTKSAEYEAERIDDTKLKIKRKSVYTSKLNNTKLTIKKAKHKCVISVVIYAPHTERIKNDPEELHQCIRNLAIQSAKSITTLNAKRHGYIPVVR